MELSEIRNQLDHVDSELLRLFLERMALVDQVADIKKETHQPLYDPKREREILAKIHESSGASYASAADQFFRTLLELSRARQAAQLFIGSVAASRVAEMCAREQAVFPQTGRVACFGIEGSNAQMAADKLFPRGDLVFFDSFSAVVGAVKAGLCQFGVLPIENSSNGSVRAVYELLRTPDLSIVRGIRLKIRHVLLAQKGADISQIRTIYTHEQAAGQCNKFLSSLGGVDVVPCSSTAHAARRAAEAHDPSVAAIASEACAKLYGLRVAADEIQNNPNNDTRFLCITKGAVCYAGADRMSLVLSCENEAGALFHTISKISAHGINMCKLESVSIPGTNFSYRFYVDLDASIHQEGIVGLLSILEHSCESFQLLGNYSELIG